MSAAEISAPHSGVTGSEAVAGPPRSPRPGRVVRSLLSRKTTVTDASRRCLSVFSPAYSFHEKLALWSSRELSWAPFPPLLRSICLSMFEQHGNLHFVFTRPNAYT